ncbi:galactonate dehydratase [Haloarchaeobius litoreus]|uniref:Galactonate dehydratase n=1 Tax=Haloarchaeobius litoreus TaxID=755306 RepID=A0ABD6DHJ4_9EURY|nr:galactonate dehydratase [Haloarchaeobius litoreus]
MELVDYELYPVPPRWLFLKLETSDGTVGWGEPVVEGRAHTVRAAVVELVEDYLLGEDPLPVADHWERLYRGGFYRGGPVLSSALAGIDQALWDIRGKHFGAAVHELLGGPVRDRVRVYQWVGGDRPEGVADAAREQVDAGFTALKMNATPELERIDSPATVQAAADRLRVVRDAVGPHVDVGVDFHGRATVAMAEQLVEALEPHDPFFVEEPVAPEHADALPRIAERTSTPIATGERCYHRTDFRPLLEAGAVDVVQPDLSHAGGITECKRIADLAATYDASLAPHCPLGPVALASCLQVDAVAPNALIQEQSLDIHYNGSADVLDYVADPSVFDYEDGFVQIPDGPGLGVAVDEDALAAASREPDWHNPVWRRADGSVAEW